MRSLRIAVAVLPLVLSIPACAAQSGKSWMARAEAGKDIWATLQTSKGTIVVKLYRDSEIQLVVEDDGVGCLEDAREGSGSMLMQLLTRQLGGTMNRTNGSPGCRVEVRVPA